MDFSANIANLGKYNAGVLAAALLSFPATTEQVQSVLREIGVDGLRYEEVIILEWASVSSPSMTAWTARTKALMTSHLYLSHHRFTHPAANPNRHGGSCHQCDHGAEQNIEHPFRCQHLIKLPFGHAHGAHHTEFPAAGKLVREGHVDQIDHAKKENHPG